MSKNKVLKILGTFPPQELKRFGSFLRRMYGRKETLLKLFDTLRKHHPNFNSPQLAHRNLYRNILPGKEFHEKRILNEMSDLSAAAEQFMIEEYLRENEYERNAILLQAYKKHQLDDLFFRQLQKMKKAIDDQEETSYTWLEKMKLAEEFYYHPSTKRITDEVPEIYKAMDYIDHFYAISKLQYACEVLNRSKVLQETTKEIRLLYEVQSVLNFNTSVCYRFYVLTLALIDRRDDDTYWELKEYFVANYRKIRPKDRLIIFNYLMNHTFHNFKKGVKAFNQEVINLYRFGIEKEIMIINGYFDIDSFQNIVVIFCKDRQYKWASKFVKKWSDYIKPEISKDIVAISDAYILFEQGKYHEAHQKITQDKKLDSHEHIRAQILLVCCYVELTQYSSNDIQYKCDSFARATQRNKVINKDTKRSVLNFLKIVKQLDKPGLNKASLIKELQEMEFVFSRKWLNEKVQAL